MQAPLRGVAVVLAALTASAVAAYQQPAFRGGVDVTVFDVTVVDQQDRPVRGLTAEDFAVRVDGQPARVVSVTPVDLPPATEDTGPAWRREVAPDVVTNAPDAGRVVVIVIDDAMAGANRTLVTGRSNTSGGVFYDPWILRTGKRIARDVVEGLGPEDRAAVVFTYIGRSQNFTTDRARLLAAIDTYQPQNGTAAGPPVGCSFRGRNGCTLDTLEHVIEALPADPPLRKVVVLIGQGLSVPGMSAEALDARAAAAANRDPASPQLDHALLMLQRMQRANVAVYSYSPGGLQIIGSRETDVLRILSENTGGRATVDTNAPWSGVPQMLADTSTYYLVGFETPARDGRFHQVQISTPRANTRVRTRVGYLAPGSSGGNRGPGARTVRGPVPPVQEAVERGLPRADVPLLASAVRRAIPGQRANEVLVTVGTPTTMRDAQGEDASAGAPWTLKLLAAAFQGRTFTQRAVETQAIEIDPRAGTLAEARVRLRLNPGQYEIRIAGEGETRAGSVFFDVEVTDVRRSRLWMSGLGLTTSAGDPSVVPLTIRRTFAAADTVRLIAQLVQRPTSDVVVNVTATDETGRETTLMSATMNRAGFDRDGIAFFDYALEMSRLTSGEHLIRVEAVADAAQTSSHIRLRRQ